LSAGSGACRVFFGENYPEAEVFWVSVSWLVAMLVVFHVW
jgi:hypothetical protein